MLWWNHLVHAESLRVTEGQSEREKHSPQPRASTDVGGLIRNMIKKAHKKNKKKIFLGKVMESTQEYLVG